MTSEHFPYAPRQGQDRLMDLVRSASTERAHLVLESGTGSGKTVGALCGCLDFCAGTQKRILYLTRTNSQQRQVMFELRRISERKKVFGVALQGRRNMCPLAHTDEELRDGNPEELSKVCGERKARVTRGDEGACRFYANTISTDLKTVMRFAREDLPTAEEFVDHCVDRGLCPYEAAKMLVPAADVVAAPYIMFFDGFIRRTLLDWMETGLSEIVLIVDEAHNLPAYARELQSAKLTDLSLRMADREVDEHGDPEIGDGTSLKDLISMVAGALDKAVDEYLVDEDGIIPQSFLEEELMFSTHVTSRALAGMISQAMNYGEMVRDQRRLDGRLPRSFVHRMAGFLTAWHTLDEAEYVKLVSVGELKALEAYCLDASIACRAVLQCHASVHMSGTLAPMEDYSETIGLPSDARLAQIPSPFPPENRLVIYADDVTSRHDDIARDSSILERMTGRITSILNEVPRNTMVFYPSYALMERISPEASDLTGGRRAYSEQRSMDQGELMELVRCFKSPDGRAVMHAITGGRISEGMDFPGEEMEVAIIAGIPYPKPTARQRAFQHFCELRFGRGWEHAVKAPTSRKVNQAIGRLIRSESDRGVAVILDKRATHFEDTVGAVRSEDVLADVEEFFGRAPPQPGTRTIDGPDLRRGLQM